MKEEIKNKLKDLKNIKIPKMPSEESVSSMVKLVGLRFIQYGSALVFLGLLLKLTIEGYQNDTALKWINLIVVVVSVGLSGFIIWKKKDHWFALRLNAILFLLLIIYASLIYSTSDVGAFSLFGRATEFFLNPVFIVVYLGLIGLIAYRLKTTLWIKIVLTLFILYLSSAFVYAALIGIGLEDSFLGVDFLGPSPTFCSPST